MREDRRYWKDKNFFNRNFLEKMGSTFDESHYFDDKLEMS